jgi:hypothetical protein
MKFGHKGHLNTRNTLSKEFFFSNSKIFLPILDELKNLGFGGDEEKFMKSKRLEPWIHSKVGGR